MRFWKLATHQATNNLNPANPKTRASSARHRSFWSTLAAIHPAPHHTPLVMEHQVHTSSVPSSRPLFLRPKLIGAGALEQTLMSSLFERHLLKKQISTTSLQSLPLGQDSWWGRVHACNPAAKWQQRQLLGTAPASREGGTCWQPSIFGRIDFGSPTHWKKTERQVRIRIYFAQAH